MFGLFGSEDVGVMASELCPTDDETLWDDFHRSYVLTVVDAAGNRSEPLEFTTKGKGRTVAPDGEVTSTRGCSTSPLGPAASPGFLGALALALTLLGLRRSRPEW